MNTANPSRQISGKVITLRHSSDVLQGNPLGDSAVRDLLVYLPPGYQSSHESYPVIWHLAAFTNSGRSANNWKGFDENLFERVDRLISAGKMGEVIVVSPDCFTSLGGNQYVNSSAVGMYSDYIHHELIPFTNENLRTLTSRAQRAVFGKSSGGYGAMMLAMKFPEYWGAFASHSGDANFDLVYRPDFPKVAETLARHDNDPAAFIRSFWQKTNRSGDEFHTLMLCCMAASYDPDPDDPLKITMPFDLHTLEMHDARWQRWLQHDPVSMLASHRKALQTMHLIYMDCGNRDQYHIHYGTRRLSQLMSEHAIEHEYEEFDGTHSGIDHRLDVSLPRLYAAIS